MIFDLDGHYPVATIVEGVGNDDFEVGTLFVRATSMSNGSWKQRFQRTEDTSLPFSTLKTFAQLVRELVCHYVNRFCDEIRNEALDAPCRCDTLCKVFGRKVTMDYCFKAGGVGRYTPQPALAFQAAAKSSVDQLVFVCHTMWRKHLHRTEVTEVANLGRDLKS